MFLRSIKEINSFISKRILHICLSISLIVPRWGGLLESQKSFFFSFSNAERFKQGQKSLRLFETS